MYCCRGFFRVKGTRRVRDPRTGAGKFCILSAHFLCRAAGWASPCSSCASAPPSGRPSPSCSRSSWRRSMEERVKGRGEPLEAEEHKRAPRPAKRDSTPWARHSPA